MITSINVCYTGIKYSIDVTSIAACKLAIKNNHKREQIHERIVHVRKIVSYNTAYKKLICYYNHHTFIFVTEK